MSSNGKRTYRTFTEQFKRDAVNLVVVEGYSFNAAAKAFGLLGVMKNAGSSGTGRSVAGLAIVRGGGPILSPVPTTR